LIWGSGSAPATFTLGNNTSGGNLAAGIGSPFSLNAFLGAGENNGNNNGQEQQPNQGAQPPSLVPVGEPAPSAGQGQNGTLSEAQTSTAATSIKSNTKNNKNHKNKCKLFNFKLIEKLRTIHILK
jgi:hypothetical protein